jgi:hypothetical protein
MECTAWTVKESDMRVQSVLGGVLTCLLCLGSAYPQERQGAAPQATYKGYTVKALMKGKGEGLDNVIIRKRGNHLVKVELLLERDPSTSNSLTFVPKCDCASIPIRELDLYTPEAVYPAQITNPGLGLLVSFDKGLSHGKGAFFAEVPKETNCSTLTVRLAEKSCK